MFDAVVVPLLLGFLEGLTEFIPVSSTGHLLIASRFLGFHSAGGTFEVVIQLGAILAVVWIYLAKIVRTLGGLGHDPQARHFALSVLIAFLPSVMAGLLLHDFIKTVLFESPGIIATALIIGGIVLLIVDRLPIPQRHVDAEHFPWRMSLGIGLAQCLSLIPGVSRSGATIVGALLMGADRRAAAEFSFFLSIPTMVAAVSYDLWENRAGLDAGAVHEIAIGFAAAFFSAIVVVRWLLAYLNRHGFAVFGWWRIIVGAGVWGLLLTGHA
ncbi:undecaprenyl-diphosphate phosphatase [Acidimangrovimonas sediminis]|uniref:Undecaprenyl-diphosphatase n=1 Tax=Albidovulum sediminis TaxID=3066345 RepID=A0ABT2NV46_9RHOB|nr:undecaprenyl-diphosphate phosphatase [Defluviimonas sediminis]MCT8331370.1 undecaprenyl-diphosphate phosphatase [Defluviimonas sediminis]